MHTKHSQYIFLIIYFLFFNLNDASAQSKKAQSDIYYPGFGEDWERRTPAQVDLNAEKLQAAIDFAIENESKSPKDLEVAHYLGFGREPFGDGVGPFKTRGPATGLVIRNGYLIAEWGEPLRVDMTFSVTKTFLSTTVALAYDRGLIKSVKDKVYPYMAPIFPIDYSGQNQKAERLGQEKVIDLFATKHNKKITWEHLLRQTSDWEGTLWGKPDWADRPSRNAQEWLGRTRNEPGSAYKYNDVRVNVLALAALNVWRRPLPQVLKEYVMDPIDASPSWRWLGYENSWVLIDGVPMQSVSGGGHWGGGMFIHAFDQARLGYLTLRRGKWKGKQIFSEDWTKMALTPTQAEPTYGFMNWFVNTDQKRFPSAPASAFAHLGAGTNMVYVDPEHDLVVVARWIDRRVLDEFIQKVLEAVE